MKPGFLIYQDYEEILSILSNEELGLLIRAIFTYEKTKVTPELEKSLKMAFNFIKKDLDRGTSNYERIVERNRINGLKGGRPKNPENPVGYLGNPENPEKPRETQKSQYKSKYKYKDKENNIYKRKNLKKEKTYTEKNLTLQELAIKFSDHFEEENGRRSVIAPNGLKNLAYWLEVYTPSQIAQAISQIKYDSFWKDKMDLTILFRQSSKGEPVNWIDTLLNKAKEYHDRRR